MSRPGQPVRTRVSLVRHGEVFNPEKVLYGRLPGFRLSDRGEQMAKVTAAWLVAQPDADIRAVISSPLERARQTAAPLAEAVGLPIDIDDRLIESTNRFEGSVVDIGPGLLRHPEFWWHVRNPLRPSWGEPYAEVAQRMLAAVADAREAARGGQAVLISHQLPVWTARRAAEGRRLAHSPRARQCALASVTTLIFDGDTLAAVRYTEPNGPTTAPGSVGA